MIVPFGHLLIFAGILFAIGVYCLLTRRNLIMMLIGLEVMLNAASIVFIGASLRWQSMEGHALVIFIMAVAAAEVSIGLAIIVALYRRSDSIDPADIGRMTEGGGVDRRQ